MHPVTCPHLPPGGSGIGAAHDDILANGAVVVIATAPAQLHGCLVHTFYHQTSRRTRGALEIERERLKYRSKTI